MDDSQAKFSYDFPFPNDVLIKWGRILATFIVLVGFIFYLYHNIPALKQVLTVNLPAVFLTIILIGCSLASSALYFQVFYQSSAPALTYRDAFDLTALSGALNYVVPFKPGLLYKATYLKQTFKTKYRRFAGYTAMSVLLVLMVNGTMFFLLISGLYYLNQLDTDIFFQQFLLSSGIVGLLLIVFALLQQTRIRKSPEHLQEEQPQNEASSDEQSPPSPYKRPLTKSALLILLMSILDASRLYAVGLGMEGHIPFLTCLLLVAFTNFSLVYQITPGNLGAREMLLSAVGSYYGQREMALAVSLVDRMLSLVVVFLIAGFVWYRKTRKT